jgi:hypothetical protein
MVTKPWHPFLTAIFSVQATQTAKKIQEILRWILVNNKMHIQSIAQLEMPGTGSV